MRIVRISRGISGSTYGELRPDGKIALISGDIFGDHHVTAEVVGECKLLAPVLPSNIVCVGLNYRRHAEEGASGVPERPMWFMKTTGSIQNPGDAIILPGTQRSDEVDFEAELAVVIGKTCRNVTRADAGNYILGYTCANDVSARDWQMKWGGGQFCQAKSFDTFCPLGPVIVTPDELPHPQSLGIRSILNGVTMQDWTTEDMIFGVDVLIEFLSASRTLPAGTVILTGTPHGVGFARKPPVWLKAGDTIVIEIDGIGRLENSVVEE